MTDTDSQIHLRAAHRRELEHLISQHLDDRIEVWAYGSRVNGQSHDASDLDLVLRAPDLQAVDSEQLHAFTEALTESCIPILVQVLDWAVLPEHFRREIERNYVVLVPAG